jgi:hypothetical protein
MDPKVLSFTTLASQEFTQAFPKPRSPCNVFSVNKGSPAELWGILTADFAGPVLRFTGNTSCGEKGHALKWRLPLCRSFGLGSDSAVSIIQEASDE